MCRESPEKHPRAKHLQCGLIAIVKKRSMFRWITSEGAKIGFHASRAEHMQLPVGTKYDPQLLRLTSGVPTVKKNSAVTPAYFLCHPMSLWVNLDMLLCRGGFGPDGIARRVSLRQRVATTEDLIAQRDATVEE